MDLRADRPRRAPRARARRGPRPLALRHPPPNRAVATPTDDAGGAPRTSGTPECPPRTRRSPAVAAEKLKDIARDMSVAARVG